jgi:hypothetical protein
MFHQPPLSRCRASTKVWVSEVVHELWLTRTSIRGLIGKAQAALADVDQRYRELDPLLDSIEALDPRRLREALGMFEAFEASVNRLSSCLSVLPHKVQVV